MLPVVVRDNVKRYIGTYEQKIASMIDWFFYHT